MQLTPNYRLRKPDGTDPVDVQDLNDNMDVLDAEVVKKLDKTGDASNVVNKFSQAGTRANLTSGEKLSLSLGKLMKWFADLKTVAFSGKYSDLTERPTIPAGGIADASKIIDNIDDIAANTQAGYMAGALALKQVNSDLAVRRILLYSAESYSANTNIVLAHDILYFTFLFICFEINNRTNTVTVDTDYLIYTNGISYPFVSTDNIAIGSIYRVDNTHIYFANGLSRLRLYGIK